MRNTSKTASLNLESCWASFAILPAESVSWNLENWIKIGRPKIDQEGMATDGEQRGDGAMAGHGGAHET